MSKNSATDTIKKLNPKNISGAVPQALDLVKNLKNIKGNPLMALAVGPDQLIGMFKSILQNFNMININIDMINNATQILKGIAPSLNLPADLVTNAGLELMGARQINSLLNMPMSQINMISDAIKLNPQLGNILPIGDIQSKIEFSLEQITNINRIKDIVNQVGDVNSALGKVNSTISGIL